MAHHALVHKTELAIRIPLGDGTLEGNLTLPDEAKSVLLFAHGSGSSRFSPRNRFVASVLHEAGMATLLIDLLTRQEEHVDLSTGHLRFDIPLLSSRLVKATDWLKENPSTRDLRIGYFGASTGAAAAMVAAAGRPAVLAVVSRGGRPDLAGQALEHVRAAVLLIVGGDDRAVLDLNQQAYRRLVHARAKDIAVIPGATHLFEESGALEKVARLAADWFTLHFNGNSDDAPR